MKVVIGGREYSNFTSGSVNAQMNAIARTFNLEATSRGVDDIPFRKGQGVEISICNRDGDFVRIFTGYIEVISMAGGETDVTYSISGRDLMGDLVDSNLDGMSDGGYSVRFNCQLVLWNLGIKSKVVDLANTDARPFESTQEIVAPDPSETAYDYLAAIAQRRQTLLTSDGFANLVVTEGIGHRTKGLLANHIDGHDNNLLTWSYETGDSNRFGIYIVDAQKNVAAIPLLGSPPAVAEIVETSREFHDTSIRITRRRAVASESSYPLADALKRAAWEANLSRTEGTQYNVTVSGFLDQGGDPWTTNTAPLVHDEYAGIEGRMLIKSVRWSFGESGETCDLGLTEVDAFKARLEAADSERLSEGDSDVDGEVIP